MTSWETIKKVFLLQEESLAGSPFADAAPISLLQLREGNWTALHFAVENQVAESVSWLLERGADINAKDTFGQTPLHLAIDSEADSSRHQFDVTGPASLSGEITKLLLKSGADANARTIRGKTPLDFARETGHSVAVEELRRYGGH